LATLLRNEGIVGSFWLKAVDYQLWRR